MAFSKKAVDQRKEWLTDFMEEGKRRRELGLPEVYLYEKDTRAVNYTDFINKELVLFSNMDNERSIPSLVDGFKPGQRKVIFTCLKRNLHKKEIKVAQLAGSVAEVSAYHHGEASLMGTIINLAQNYVGSNNINLLQPIGQFGTRLSGGKDSASPRYIFTQMSPLARMIFNENDDAILHQLTDDNQKIEPEWYIPILPMVLVNGADGIGTGWMTKIPNYNPREIVANIRKMMKGEEPKDMVPWFKNFKGSIEPLDHQRYVVNGEIATLSDTKLEVTELPVKTWTNQYKELLETMLAGNEKQPAVIQDYKDYNTDTTVKFIVQMNDAKLRDVERSQGLHTFFKLQTTMSTTSMVLFDHLGCLRKFENVGEILREFFTLRLDYYGKRKKYMEGLLGSEACKLSNQARFILEKCDGTLKIENKKKKIMIDELARRGYDSDPIKSWKRSVAGGEEEEEDSGDDPDSQEVQGGKEKGPDYDYLLGMPMWNLTQEKKDEICKKRDDKQQELERLKATTKEQLWETDLEEFMVKLDEVEAKEEAEAAAAPGNDGGGGGGGGKGGSKKGKGKKGIVKMETLPSAAGIRVVPRIAEELKLKTAKAIAAKERKANKEEKVKVDKSVKPEKDEFDMMADTKESGLSESGKKMKQSTISFKPKKEASKAKEGNPWSDSDGSEDMLGSDIDGAVTEVAPRERAAGRRAATTKQAKYKLDESGSAASETDEDMFGDNKRKLDSSGSEMDTAPVKKVSSTKTTKPKKSTMLDSSEGEDAPEDVLTVDSDTDDGEKKTASKDEFDVSDSGSDGGGFARKVAAQPKKPPKKLAKDSELFSGMMAAGGVAKKTGSSKTATKKSTMPAKKKKLASSGSEDDNPPKKAKS